MATEETELASPQPGEADDVRSRAMRVGVLGNVHYGELKDVVEMLRRAADRIGVTLVYEARLAKCLHGAGPVLEQELGRVDWLLTLGGDGTLLRGAHMAGPRAIPVLGCNLGRLGFLTMISRDELELALERVARGEVSEEERIALQVRVRRGDSGKPDGEVYYSVNDAVIHKSGFARMITLRVWVDEEEVGQYSADGIILSTPTGSTAYSLSAGGPILAPGLDGLVATPISPHTLAVRSVVLPAAAQISVELGSEAEEISLTIDGQPGSVLYSGDRVEAARSQYPLRLLCFPGHSFFSVLRRKLRWGDVRPTDV
ncbi:MAG: NAD(+)/NADH kinase [Gemmatimonadota bacterium]